MATVGSAGPAGFAAAWGGARRAVWDTSAAIYWLGREPTYSPLLGGMVSAARAGQLMLVLSVITELELLVKPLRTADRQQRIGVLRLLARPYVEVVETTRRLARRAAALRASEGLRVPDALVVATAAVSNCDLLVGNDRAWRTRALPVPYLCLSDFTASS